MLPSFTMLLERSRALLLTVRGLCSTAVERPHSNKIVTTKQSYALWLCESELGPMPRSEQGRRKQNRGRSPKTKPGSVDQKQNRTGVSRPKPNRGRSTKIEQGSVDLIKPGSTKLISSGRPTRRSVGRQKPKSGRSTKTEQWSGFL